MLQAIVLLMLLGLASASQAITVDGISGGTFETPTHRNFWNFNYYPGGATTSSGPFENRANAHNGDWYAYLGDRLTTSVLADGYISQWVETDESAEYFDIAYYLSITTAEATTRAYDTMEVWLRFFTRNDGRLVYEERIANYSNVDRNPNNLPGEYTLKTHRYTLGDLVPLRPLLLFKVRTDDSLYTTFRIDDVSLNVKKPDLYSVEARVNGSGGTVAPVGQMRVVAGSTVEFTARPDLNYEVDLWRVNGAVFQNGGLSFRLTNVSEDRNVEVIFRPTGFRLNVTIEGAGEVMMEPPGGVYAAGTRVTLIAVPRPGSQFLDWIGQAFYRRESRTTVEKGGADETIAVRFIPIIEWADTRIAHSTPPTSTSVSFVFPTFNDWLTVLERSRELPYWELISLLTDPNLSVPRQQEGNEFYGASTWARVSAPRFLTFPLRGPEYGGPDPRMHQVISVMDHQRPGFSVKPPQYTPDDQVGTYAGETFRINDFNRRDGNSVAITGFTKPVDFNYTGERNPSGGFHNDILNYDGHPGYDFRADESTDVYPAADGNVIASDPDDPALTELIRRYARDYHALVVDHGGFRTVYMHLSSVSDSSLADTSTDAWIPLGGRVSVNSPLGKVGRFLRRQDGTIDPNMGPHLHFEVWRKDPVPAGGHEWILVDPYGKKLVDGSPLWEPLW